MSTDERLNVTTFKKIFSRYKLSQQQINCNNAHKYVTYPDDYFESENFFLNTYT